MTREEAIKVAYGIPVTKAQHEALQFLIPELAESEDEKTRKALVWHLKADVDFVSNGVTKAECIAYLEKQKELPTNEEMLRTLRTEYEKGVADTIAKYEQKEQKPAEWSEFDKGVLNDAICATDTLGNDESFNKSNPNLAKAFRVAKDWLKSLPDRLNLQPKQEWGEVELEFRGEKVKVKRPFFRDDKGHEYSTAEQDEDVAWYAFRAWCEKKGVSLYDLYPRQDEDVAWYAFRAWCEKKGVSLYDLYPREEWSEEDEKILNELLDYFNTENATWYNWLKSLRPQPKQDVFPSLSEKEIIFLKRVLDYLRKEHNRYGGEDFTNEIAVLEWLITHPILVSDTHWKPSEEQMKQLKSAADLPEFGPMVTTRKEFPDLESLYEQLKKL